MSDSISVGCEAEQRIKEARTKGLVIWCAWCGKQVECPGALLFSPPNLSNG